MTNVKLKLMFFLLNSLLSADIVYSRPYSNANSTDVVIFNENSNNTFSLPIDPNSDTLRVTNDYEVKNEKQGKETKAAKEAREEKEAHEARETDKSSKTSLDAIVNAEQDRDEALSKKVMKDQIKFENKNPEPDTIEKQSNISSSLLEDIINSETDREDTITDILFRKETEFAEDVPKFEFLIAGKINESEVNRTAYELERDRNSSDVLKKVDYVELVEVIKPGKENSSAYMLNITVHEVDDDLAPDTSFTDVQTLFLACFGTLIPLLAVLFATLFIRCLCRRYCPTFCKKPTSSSASVSSDKQDANQQKHKKAARIPNIFAAALHLDQRKRHWFTPFENRSRKDKLKSPTEESTGTGDAENGEAVPANGSIFTMTLKNNHLIVETEERNDITKNGRETKMKYSPDNDGIFVVEVQQSTAYRPKNIQNSPPQDPQISTNQAIIHRVPEEIEKKEEDSEKSTSKIERDKALALSSTGLSISDLSMSSIGSHNISYSYSSQMGYEQGPFGYPIYTGYEIKEDINEGIVNDNSQEPLISKTPDYDKPVVTAAIFKQDSIIGNDLQGPGYCIEGSTDGPLLSDVQAREYSLQHLHDQKNIENGIAVPIEKVEGMKSFNRADSLPVRLEEDSEVLPMETIEETPKDGFIKRGSLPTIKADLYETVKDVILGSPKFDKFVNDSSGEYDCPPMITITEESESSKSEATS